MQDLRKLSQTPTKEPGGLFSRLSASLSSPSPPPGHHLQPASAGPGGRAACALAQGPWQKGPKPKYIHVLCIQPNSKSKEAGRLPVEPSSWGRQFGKEAGRHRQFGIVIAPDSAPGSPSALGGRRLVWSGVSASRAGALGTGHRRHWFVVSWKELHALLYSSPSFVRACLRPGRIRTPGNH